MLEVQYRKKRNIVSFKATDDGLYLYSERGIIRLLPIKDDVVRVSYTEEDKFGTRQGSGYARAAENIRWDIKSPGSSDDDKYELHTDKIDVLVDAATGSISFFDKTGKCVLKEKQFESKIVEPFDSFKTIEDENAQIEEIRTADGVKRRIKAAQKEFDRRLYHTVLSLDFDENEVIFGLGQSPEGVWNLRGTTQYLHQANLKSPIPLFLSSKGYGIFLSSKSSFIFDDSCYGTKITTHADEYLDYYFCLGEPKAVVKSMRFLSGKASLLPKWGFGYVQSQERYESEKELLDTAQKFEDMKLPISSLVLDWMSWPDNLWGQKSLDPLRFPTPDDLMDKLHEKGIHLIISIWPNMGEGGSNFDEFKKNGLFLPNSHFYNPFVREGRDLYWKQVNEGIFCHNVDGWWGDNCEPVTPEWERPQAPAPSEGYRDFVEAASKIMPEDEINTFCINHSRAVFEGQKHTGSDKRVINLTRCGYPGSQKYGAVVWSGDISAGWDTLRRQITAGLSFMITGMAYWNLDIGAFFVKRGEQWYWNGDFDEGLDDPMYRELYLRWLQYGAFLPLMRCHGTDVRREPWNVAGNDGHMFEIMKKTIYQRYALLPYIYSLAADTYFNDGLIVRPLVYDFPSDLKAAAIGDEFMLGPSLLVCPVYDSSEENKGRKTIYLPEGCKWYHLYTHQKYEGGCEISVELSDEFIPVFAKEGAIIPLDSKFIKESSLYSEAVKTDFAEYETEKGLNFPENDIELLVFSGADSKFTLYNDSSDGYGYMDGEYSVCELTYIDAGHAISKEWHGKNEFVQKVDKITII